MSFSPCRLERLKARLCGLDARAMYVRDTANIEWLSGFEDVFDEERAHAAFVPAGEGAASLHTDSRYMTAMEREAEGTPVEVDAERVGMAAWARKRWDELGESGIMAIEDSILLSEYRALQKAFEQGTCFSFNREGQDDAHQDVRLNEKHVPCSKAPSASVGVARFLETSDLVLKLRAVKDADEIRRMKKAQAVTDAAFAHIVGFIRPGVTEREIQLELDGFMLSHGADALAFPSIVASGANGASPHAIVSDKPLQAGECVVMDFGAKRAGYCSDMTRTVFLGAPEGEMLAAWETLRCANEEVEAALRPGMTGAEAHELAERVLADGGFGGRMGHGLGHGVGLQIHELPVLSPRNDKPLAPGNVVTVEPGIYIPGRFGMRLEDFGVVTERGFERFTQSTHDLVVL